MQQKNYIAQLTFLRFLAALLVVIYHYGRSTYPFNFGNLQKIASQGQAAVSFFFFLSGLVLTINYLNKPIEFKNFFLKRIARIYPIYLLAFIATLFLTIFLNNSKPSVISILLQLFSLHAWIPKFALQINYPSWSIAVEMFFYLLFPLLVRYFKNKTLKNSALTIVLFWVFSNFVNYYLFTNYYQPNTTNFGKLLMYFPLLHFNTFLVGILGGKILLQLNKVETNFKWIYRLSYLTGIILLLLVFTKYDAIIPFMNNGLLAPIFFMILVGLALDVSMVTKIASHKFLVYLGDSSYGLYILQFPIYILFQKILHQETLQGNLFYLYLVSLILISLLFYHYFEKNAQTFLLKKWKLIK